ncbi:MAG: hypothetical protein IT337_01575 [Thermomicrobiales bacterium]|nr:hypothetical protein [Thermomicrobiales bacterium]
MNLSDALNQTADAYARMAAASVAAHDPEAAEAESALERHCRRIATNHRALAILSGDPGDDPQQIEAAR